jgi:hypothetical protein
MVGVVRYLVFPPTVVVEVFIPAVRILSVVYEYFVLSSLNSQERAQAGTRKERRLKSDIRTSPIRM